MTVKWNKTKYKGVRYREHPTRKHGVKKDRYYAIRYQRDGVRIEEGLGWASEIDPKDRKHWTAEKAALVLAELREAGKGLKEGPSRLSERRDIEDKRRAEEQAQHEQAERDAITFDKFFTETYLPQARSDKGKKTVVHEEEIFRNRISLELADKCLKDIAPFHLERLKKTLADKGLSIRSIEYTLAVVRQVFNSAKRLGAFNGENPTAKVKFPKPDNSRMRFLTHDEAKALLVSLKAKSQDVHDMTLLSLHAGLRFGEIASLTCQDVDLERGVMTIRDAKTGSRYAFITPQVGAMLKERTQGRPTDYVFQRNRKDGGRLTKISHTFFRVVDELKLNEGIDDPRLQVCFHTCRHTYASWLIEEGADLYTVQKLLGHKTNVMTQRYAHLSENKLRDAVKALGQAFQREKETTTAGTIVELPGK